MNNDFSEWVGRSESAGDVLEPTRSNALSVALGDPVQHFGGQAMPLLHHWLYFWDVRPPEQLGTDGHPLRGGFLPPVELPRRMWAGGRLNFVRPLQLGETVRRDSTIKSVASKQGRSGQLVFVTVEHRLHGQNGLAVVEEQDIVYREAAAAGSVKPPVGTGTAPGAAWHESVLPDPVLLFRYSALTMNAHRIHYDRPYALNEEAYPGLVVHGPLQATLLIRLAQSELERPITRLEFRGQAPAFAGTRLHVCGEPTPGGADLWTEQGGARTMVVSVSCAEPA